MNKIDEEQERQLLISYRDVIAQQFCLARYGVTFEYSDKLSYKEREVYLEVLTDEILPNIVGDLNAK